MSYTPIIPMTGNAGWSFLQRTLETQKTAFESSTVTKRDTDYFAENIGKVSSAEDLVKDFRLLKVALGAFGLDDQTGSKFLIRKVLEEGTTAEEALANKMSDGRYQALSAAFGFEHDPPKTKEAGFADTIIAAYKERQFEVAVGEQDENMRLALALERDLASVVTEGSKAETAWYRIMGTKSLRAVFEGALNLPTATGALDVDKQLTVFQDKAEKYFGTSDPADFLQPERLEELTRRFLVQADLQATASSMSGGSIALMLLQSSGSIYG